MRAVNLIPTDARRTGLGTPGGTKLGAMHVVIGVLVIALGYVTLYVMTSNTISKRKADLATANSQLASEQAQVAQLNRYQQFAKLAQQRAATVRQIAGTRFDWHGALTDLSKVVPANTSLQSLVATVSPGVSVSGGAASAGSASSVRGDINAPAFQVKGCTANQDDVARLVSRLRLINGVSRVTLEDSTKQSGTAAGSGASAGTGGCAANAPSFDMVVFFQPLPAAASAGGAQTVGTSTGAAK